MRTLKWISSYGSKEISYFATSTKELRQAFLCFGMDAWVVKWGGKYDIMYPGENRLLIPVNVRCVDGMTLAKWVEIAQKNCPEKNKGESWEFMYGDKYRKAVEADTLEKDTRRKRRRRKSIN